MNLQDRAYAVGIFVILGICCIGGYVAFSGFLNVSQGGLNLGLNGATATIAEQPTAETTNESLAQVTVPPLPTITVSPGGTLASPNGTPRTTPTAATLTEIPTITPATTVPSPTSASQGCPGFPFCARLKGPPSADAPTGNPCPANYLWGFVLDSSGNGIPAARVRFRNPSGDTGIIIAKSIPDPPGRYDIPAAGGIWVLQLVDGNGNPLSAAVSMQAHVNFTGGGCPTRVDFVQQ